MSTYRAYCPYCNYMVDNGHGIPWKTLGSPIKRCSRCGKPYVDNNMYEWAVTGIPFKLVFYFCSNNRYIPLILAPLLGGASGHFLIGAIIAILWAAGCFLWVRLTKKQQMEESKQRCSKEEYVDLLIEGGYNKFPVDF